jgi:hypothetical protein
MTLRDEMRLIAVYDSDAEAREAVRTLERSGIDTAQVRVDDRRDHVSAIEGEMRSEVTHSAGGPAVVGPFTEEMARGSLLGIVVGAIVGLLLGLPVAIIGIGDVSGAASAALALGVGAIVGATAGWIIVGSFAARRSEEPLAGERGSTVAVPLTASAEKALVGTGARRIDIVEADGHPVSVVAERDPGLHTVRDVARHMRNEERQS